jgi:hypothetical protein
MLEDRPKGRFNSPGEVLRHRVACEGTNASAKDSEEPLEGQDLHLSEDSAELMRQRGLGIEVGSLNRRGQEVCPEADTGWNGR